jgi:hypothetical protein
MDVILMADDVSLACDISYLALLGMELHVLVCPKAVSWVRCCSCSILMTYLMQFQRDQQRDYSVTTVRPPLSMLLAKSWMVRIS